MSVWKGRTSWVVVDAVERAEAGQVEEDGARAHTSLTVDLAEESEEDPRTRRGGESDYNREENGRTRRQVLPRETPVVASGVVPELALVCAESTASWRIADSSSASSEEGAPAEGQESRAHFLPERDGRTQPLGLPSRRVCARRTESKQLLRRGFHEVLPGPAASEQRVDEGPRQGGDEAEETLTQLKGGHGSSEATRRKKYEEILSETRRCPRERAEGEGEWPRSFVRSDDVASLRTAQRWPLALASTPFVSFSE